MTDRNVNDVLHDILEDPSRYGLPTFEEFQKDPESWTKQKDDVLAAVDNGFTTHRQLVKKQKYFYEGYECRTLEDVERCAKSDGIDTLANLDCVPQIIPSGDGKCDIYVKFTLKKGHIIT